VPRRVDPDGADPRPDPVAAQLVAALTGTHTTGTPVAVAWLRTGPGRPIDVLLGGGPELGIEPGVGQVRPLYPPGSLGTAVSYDQVAAALAGFPAWLRCTGASDVLTVEPPESPYVETSGTFEQYVAQLSRTPFAWLVVAEPIPLDDLRAEMGDLAYEIPRLRGRREQAEAHRIELERSEARYRELAQAETGGLWDVHILVGGATEPDVRRVAALLCGASELTRLPYTLRPAAKPASPFGQALAEPIDAGRDGASPFRASSGLLAAIARPPAKELPGIRLVTANTFDVTAETGGDITLGEILDESLEDAGPFQVSTETLNRHVLVCGATGAGKSQTVRALLEELHRRGLPWLVIEPAKAEYARMAGRLDGGQGVLVIRPGESDVTPASLNPLEPEAGFPLQTHIDLVRALFLAAFEAQEPFPQVLSYALTRCYEELGWELALSESRLPGVLPKYPTLGDLQRTAKEVVEAIGYGRQVTSDVRGFIDVRLGSLRLGTPGRFFEGGHPVDIGELLRRNVVLELEDIGNDQDKAFFIGTVLIRLVEHLRLRHGKREDQLPLAHVTVVEEAHRLLKHTSPGTPAAHAVELFAGLLAEIRAYGEGIVVAEQIPSKILPDVIKNTALKIVHRLPAHDDRLAVGATMNLDDRQSEYVVTLPPGQAAVFADGMDRPLLVRMPLGEDRESARDASRTVRFARTRSATCGSACQQRPCTLREMSEAKRLAEDPRLTLWIELLTIAHVVGEPEPDPRPEWLAELRDKAAPRVLECAIGGRAQTAIDSRYTALIDAYQPEALAVHITDRARQRLAGVGAPCDGREVQWQAGRFRWIDVARALKRTDWPTDQPHPLTAEWRARGLSLPGRNRDEQLKAFRRHPSSWLPSTVATHGSTEPPIFEGAVARLSNAPDPIGRLEEAKDFLRFHSKWPAQRLYPEEWAVARQGGTT
jgi:DNA helicase HerA-like ATPase